MKPAPTLKERMLHMLSDSTTADVTFIVGDGIPLRQRLADWAKKNVDASNACRFLPVAELFNELSETCWQVVLYHGDNALESDAFLGLPRELLEKMLRSNELSADEKRVFDRTVMWAERQLEKNGKNSGPADVRATLGDVLYLIRFPLFDATEFSDGPAESGILADKECVALFQWFTTRKKPSLFRVDTRCGTGLEKLVELHGMRLCFECPHLRQVKTNVGNLRAALETAMPSCQQQHRTRDSFWVCLTCYAGFCAVTDRCGPYGHSEDSNHVLYMLKNDDFCELICALCREKVASV